MLRLRVRRRAAAFFSASMRAWRPSFLRARFAAFDTYKPPIDGSTAFTWSHRNQPVRLVQASSRTFHKFKGKAVQDIFLGDPHLREGPPGHHPGQDGATGDDDVRPPGRQR